MYLSNPQKHNSYSYAFNNPLKYEDNNGEFGILGAYASYQAYEASTEYAGEKLYEAGYGDAANQLSSEHPAWNMAISNPEIAGPIVGASSGIAAAGVTQTVVTYYGVATLSSAGGSTLQIVGQVAYGTVTGYAASQIPDQTVDFLSDLDGVQNNVPGAAQDALVSGAVLYGPQALGEGGQAAWDLSSATFDGLDYIFSGEEYEGTITSSQSLQKSSTTQKKPIN